MLNLFTSNKQSEDIYTQDQLFNKIVLPVFKVYPEIAFLANNKTASTNEGTASNNDFNSWTYFLIKEGLLENTFQKHIELERTLHSLVCFNLILDGSKSAYNYWTQQQKLAVLTVDSFERLHDLAINSLNTPELFKVIEASLVYSDLGKSQEIKNLGIKGGLIIDDHDDFMEALYGSNATIREKIIPSFESLPQNIKQHIIELNTSVPIHWGYFLQLEGGQHMFAKLLNSNKITAELLKQNFLINICDIAGALAHVTPLGSLTFNEHVWSAFQMVLETIEQFLIHRNPAKAYLDLMHKKANYLGYPLDDGEDEKFAILTRIGFFLRLYTREDGALLKKHSDIIYSAAEWSLVKKCFGINSGINVWKHHPTYIPAVLLNLFNSTSDISDKYKRALNGFVVLAKIVDEYQKLEYHNSESPLCFNKLAAQAKCNRELFAETFEISQINWDDPKNIIINYPRISLKYSSKP